MAKQQGKTKNERFVELSWLIISNKWHYYVNGRSIIADEAYDRLADEYRTLAKELNLNPYADEMVGFDFSRPSARLVDMKLRGIPLGY
jgi:NAD-dependent DNA ligase